jgi:hypothetical protein
MTQEDCTASFGVLDNLYKWLEAHFTLYGRIQPLPTIPPGIDAELDELVKERLTLIERFSDAHPALEEAKRSLPAAKQLDREAIGAAMRADERRPERENTQIAEQAISSAEEDLRAIKLGQEANEADTVTMLTERKSELMHVVGVLRDNKRTPCLEAAEQLMVLLGPVRLDQKQLRQLGQSGKTGVPVANVMDMVMERLECAYLDHELLQIAQAAGLEGLTAVERRDTGGANLGGPPQPGRAQKLITNLSAVGLTKFTLAKGRTSTQLIVALDTLSTMHTIDVLRLNAQQVTRALVDGKRIVISQDDTTRQLMDRLRPDKSSAAQKERAERLEGLQETRRMAEQREAAQEKLLEATTT